MRTSSGSLLQINSRARRVLWVCICLLSGCASTHQLEKAQYDVRNSFASHKFSRTSELLREYRKNNIYRSKDRVLYNLEMGMAQHFSARYDSSSYHFSLAEEQMDQLYTKSISRGIQSFLFTNDNELEYDGEDYEDIYLNIFKSLNYLHGQDLESARVEASRISYKLSQLEVRYEGMTEALSKSDTLQLTTWRYGKTSVHDSALGRYLSAVLYAKTDRPDDARIEYEKMLETIARQPSRNRHERPGNEDLQTIRNPASYNILLTAFAGRAPVKRQHNARLYLPEEDLYLKFSFPVLRLYDSKVSHVQAVIDDTLKIPLHLIEEMDLVAREVYRIKEPVIYTRALLRSLVKAAGTGTVSRLVKKKNRDLGFLIDIFGKIGQEMTEKADLRSWQTMPGQAFVNVVKLSPGDHQCEIQYLDASGNVLYNREMAVGVTGGNRLQLLETLYWN